MNILFTVCGRAGSKGIKGKNLKKFLGCPLVYYTLAAIQLYKESNSEDDIEIALNTDSWELVRLVQDSKIPVVYIERKENLAGDMVSKKAVIADTWIEMEKAEGKKYDMIVDCDITSPLRTVEDIKHLIEKKRSSDFDVVFSVTDSRRNPYFNMVSVNSNGKADVVIKSKFTARQQAPQIFDMNASLYAYSPYYLSNDGHMFDFKCGTILMRDTAVLDLDNACDFEFMEIIAKYLFTRYDDFKLIAHRAFSYDKENYCYE